MDLVETILPRSEGINKFSNTEVKPAPVTPTAPTPKVEEKKELTAEEIAAAAGTTKVEPPPPDPTKVRNAQVFAEKARQERELHRLRAELKARDQAIAEKEKLVAEYEARKALARTDPVKAAKEALGLDVEDINNFVLNNNQPTAETQVKQVREEIAALKAQVEAEKKQLQQERENAKLEHDKMLVNDLRANISNFVKANNEVYEQINVQEAEGLVYDVIVEHAKQTKAQGQAKLLSYKDACDHVEKWLEQRVEASLNTKKFKERFSKQEQPPEQKPGTETKEEPVARPTLNNQMTSSAQAAQQRALSREERIKRAMLVGR